jgi:U3 small nucleolar RNA-associated protein 20
MAEGVFEQHLKQVVANIGYEHQEGRMAAINMLLSLIQKMPEELLNTNAQLIFLPLVLQKVNDDSKECREGVTKCLVLLLTRCSAEVQRSCHNYCVRWSKGQGPLLVASLQVFGIFVESCTDFMKKNNYVPGWVEQLEGTLQSAQSDWEVVYFSLISVEKLSKHYFDSYLRTQDGLWIQVVEHAIDSHPWVKLATARILNNFLSSDGANTCFENNPGLLFKILRNICFQLGVDEKEQSEELSDMDIKILTLLLPTIQENKHLCFSDDDKEKEATGNPVLWLMRRLSGVAKAKGKLRRMAVFKCFAAFSTKHAKIVATYLEPMLEALHRSSTEASNEAEVEAKVEAVVQDDGDSEMIAVMTESSLARDVIQLIEETAEDATVFLKAYAAVKSRAQEKKDERKSTAKAEAIRDPKAFAEKKIKKHEQETPRKKRRVDDRRRDRGGRAKRRHVSS